MFLKCLLTWSPAVKRPRVYDSVTVQILYKTYVCTFLYFLLLMELHRLDQSVAEGVLFPAAFCCL